MLVEHILMRAITIIGCIIGILHSYSDLIEMDSFVIGSMELMILGLNVTFIIWLDIVISLHHDAPVQSNIIYSNLFEKGKKSLLWHIITSNLVHIEYMRQRSARI